MATEFLCSEFGAVKIEEGERIPRCEKKLLASVPLDSKSSLSVYLNPNDNKLVLAQEEYNDVFERVDSYAIAIGDDTSQVLARGQSKMLAMSLANILDDLDRIINRDPEAMERLKEETERIKALGKAFVSLGSMLSKQA